MMCELLILHMNDVPWTTKGTGPGRREKGKGKKGKGKKADE